MILVVEYSKPGEKGASRWKGRRSPIRHLMPEGSLLYMVVLVVEAAVVIILAVMTAAGRADDGCIVTNAFVLALELLAVVIVVFAENGHTPEILAPATGDDKSLSIPDTETCLQPLHPVGSRSHVPIAAPTHRSHLHSKPNRLHEESFDLIYHSALEFSMPDNKDDGTS